MIATILNSLKSFTEYLWNIDDWPPRRPVIADPELQEVPGEHHEGETGEERPGRSLWDRGGLRDAAGGGVQDDVLRCLG